jgi:hypothetical protein
MQEVNDRELKKGCTRQFKSSLQLRSNSTRTTKLIIKDLTSTNHQSSDMTAYLLRDRLRLSACGYTSPKTRGYSFPLGFVCPSPSTSSFTTSISSDGDRPGERHNSTGLQLLLQVAVRGRFPRAFSSEPPLQESLAMNGKAEAR